MTLEAARQLAKDDLTKIYFADVPCEYQRMFEAVERAYQKEYPILKKTAAFASKCETFWSLDTDECQKTLRRNLEQIEPRIRRVFLQVERAEIRSEALSQLIDKQITNFDLNCYTGSKPKQFITPMTSMKQLVDKVHEFLTNSLSKLKYLGNNLLSVLKEGHEISYYNRTYFVAGEYVDVYQLSAFTPKVDSEKRESWASVITDGQRSELSDDEGYLEISPPPEVNPEESEEKKSFAAAVANGQKPLGGNVKKKD